MLNFIWLNVIPQGWMMLNQNNKIICIMKFLIKIYWGKLLITTIGWLKMYRGNYA